jgi:hypothetical protein
VSLALGKGPNTLGKAFVECHTRKEHMANFWNGFVQVRLTLFRNDIVMIIEYF